MRRLACALLLAIAAPALAEGPSLADTPLRDPAAEQQARALMETIRCVVCQSQSIADSNAEIAGDMRSVIRERIAHGDSPAQVRAWLIQRYGDYITYDPPFTAATWFLWLAPLALLAIGVMIARTSFRKR
jgi:cytochrome c-type biogenesis protein CcmH